MNFICCGRLFFTPPEMLCILPVPADYGTVSMDLNNIVCIIASVGCVLNKII